jgi:drug/metabolite transporter (DMT)-like permease
MNQTAPRIDPGSRALTATNLVGMVLLALIWGLSVPVTKLGLVTMPPLTLTTLRFAIAVPLLLILIIGRKRLPLAAMPRVAALGVLGIGVGQVAQTFCVQETSASVGTVITATIPIFVVVFAALRLKQPVSPLQIVGLVTAFGGIGLVAYGDGAGSTGPAQTTALGVLLGLVSALAVAFYYVWGAQLTEQYGMAVVAAWSTLFGLVPLLPFAGWEMGHTSFRFTVEAMLSAVYLGVAVTAAGLFLWLWLLKQVPARMAASVQYLQPVFGVVASALMFGDRMGPLFFGGASMILMGIALAMTPGRTKKRKMAAQVE